MIKKQVYQDNHRSQEIEKIKKKKRKKKKKDLFLNKKKVIEKIQKKEYFYIFKNN